MGIIDLVRRLFSKLAQKPTSSYHGAGHARYSAEESEDTLVPSQPSTLRHRTSRYLEELRKAVNRHISRTLSFHQSRAGCDATEIEQLSPLDTSNAGSEHQGLERYQPMRILGKGGNGVVHLCRDNSIGTLVAVKTIRHADTTAPSEVQILRLLGQHPNIVQYHTMQPHPTIMYDRQLVFEYCPTGDLADYVNETMIDHTPEMFLWQILKHVTNGLRYMHSQGMVHGDIKPANILLSPPPAGEYYPLLKLADFGAASLNTYPAIPRGHIGTKSWQPPEASWRTGPEADMWALGCVVHELAVRCSPCTEISEPDMQPEEWFDLGGWVVPNGTPYVEEYKDFCHFMAFHPPKAMRIDREREENPMPYSKLLNWVMMRALDTNYRSRITAAELHRMVLVLEPLVHKLMVSGQERVLNRFDDGRDAEWRTISAVGDSDVLQQVFRALATHAHGKKDMEVLMWGKGLLKLVVDEDRLACLKYAAGLNFDVVS